MLLRHRRIFFLFLGMVHCSAALPLRAQAPQPSPSPTPEEPLEAVQSGFVLFSLLKKPAALKCMIGTNNVVLDASADPVGAGYASSLMPWRPAKGSLLASAKGYQSAELKPFLQMGETPVLVLQEKPSGTLSFSVIKNAESRGGAFYDAINLTKESSLSVTANGKKFLLPRSQRVRLGPDKRMEFKVDGGPSDVLESADDPSHLVIFYTDAAGKIGFSVVPDMLLQ
jgi:hypothetical protein